VRFLPGASPPPPIHPTGVQILWLDVQDFDPTAECLRSLSSDERARADRFVHDAARTEFILGRMLLRCVLGAVQGCLPGEVSIEISSSGRPFSRSVKGLNFNLSHASGRVVLALGWEVRVGLDLESWTREIADWRALAPVVLAPSEVAELKALDELRSRRGFLRAWVAKEALLKALGTGLQSDPRLCLLSGFSLENTQPRILSLPGDELPEDWEIGFWEMESSHLGAIAHGRIQDVGETDPAGARIG
jgi:4'-phosphopantetheinyl transferase